MNHITTSPEESNAARVLGRKGGRRMTERKRIAINRTLAAVNARKKARKLAAQGVTP